MMSEKAKMTDSSLENQFEEESILAQVQGAFIALENESGQILCMIGGKKFDPNNRFNYAMQARRQPGSSFKPFVYSAALDSGRLCTIFPASRSTSFTRSRSRTWVWRKE